MVDDNPENLRIGKNILAEKYIVATSPSAEKLFILLENSTPAMILLDVNMPDIDGFETIKVLKSRAETREIPVIFLINRSENFDELSLFSLGAIDYIGKPILPALFLKRIEINMLIQEQKNIIKKQTEDLKYFNDNLQKMVDNKIHDILQLQNALLRTMAELVEYRDDITGKHIERTQKGIRIMLTEIRKNGIYP
jgi:putative two-component system response regulator